jgi:hypothetical protein
MHFVCELVTMLLKVPMWKIGNKVTSATSDDSMLYNEILCLSRNKSAVHRNVQWKSSPQTRLSPKPMVTSRFKETTMKLHQISVDWKANCFCSIDKRPTFGSLRVWVLHDSHPQSFLFLDRGGRWSNSHSCALIKSSKLINLRFCHRPYDEKNQTIVIRMMNSLLQHIWVILSV